MNLDINVTSTCNLGCKYCCEGHNPIMPDLSKIENSKTSIPITDIVKFIRSVHNKTPDEIIFISFWGGEPMMNMQYCSELMESFINDIRIKFFFYTNGTYIKKYKKELKYFNDALGKTQNGESRLSIQISYDGRAINDIERLTKTNECTTPLIKEAFEILGELGIERQFKSTITPRTFHLIYESFLDIISIEGSKQYFPTPDTHSDYDIDKIDQYMNDLKVGLQKIAKYIYDNKLPLETFKWFKRSRALCQAGNNYFSINLDGAFSPCHGTMYEEHQDHEICFINDESILSSLDNASLKYKNLLTHMNDDCTGCTALFCLKCPAGSFSLESTKKTVQSKINSTTNEYDLKWSTKNINLCKIFKLNDAIHKSLLSIK